MAWADGLTGVSQADTAQRQGCCVNTVKARRKKVAAFIAEKFDIDEYRLPLYGLYPLWLNSVIHNLKKNDTTLTIAMGKGLGLFVERRELDANANLSNLSNDELAKRILDRIGAGREVEG